MHFNGQPFAAHQIQSVSISPAIRTVYRSSFIPNYYSIQASRKSLIGFQQGDYQLKWSQTPNWLWLSQEIIRSALDIWFELEAGSLAAGNSRKFPLDFPHTIPEKCTFLITAFWSQPVLWQERSSSGVSWVLWPNRLWTLSCHICSRCNGFACR